MRTGRRTVLTFGALLLIGALLGALVVWVFTGAGERGHGLGRGALDTPAETFTLGGEVTEVIAPGVFVPLDLEISNPNSHALAISGVVVTVSAVNAPNATTQLPCTVKDFDVKPAAKGASIVVAAKSTTTLSRLGVPSTSWPQVGMVLDPKRNQNGCKGAALTLTYTAQGQVP